MLIASRLITTAVAVLAAVLSLTPATADDRPTATAQPLWEAGIAGIVGYVPDYPAAGRNRVQPLPLPYFIYRGQFFRSDTNGVRLEALRQPRFEFDVSFGASLASNAGRNSIRDGLPDLDYLLEAGPNLRVILWRPQPSSRFSLELPVRSVISTDFLHFGDRGFLFAPRLSWLDRPLDDHGLRLHVQLGPDFATEKLQDYFYEVAPQFARADRPAFDAQGGYLGTNLDISLSRPITRRVRLFAATKLSYFGGAQNQASPLFQDRFNYGIFLGFSWSFWQSHETAARAE
jgi:MipA family protein